MSCCLGCWTLPLQCFGFALPSASQPFLSDAPSLSFASQNLHSELTFSFQIGRMPNLALHSSVSALCCSDTRSLTFALCFSKCAFRTHPFILQLVGYLTFAALEPQLCCLLPNPHPNPPSRALCSSDYFFPSLTFASLSVHSKLTLSFLSWLGTSPLLL